MSTAMSTAMTYTHIPDPRPRGGAEELGGSMTYRLNAWLDEIPERWGR